MKVVRWKPVTEMLTLRNGFDGLFDDFLGLGNTARSNGTVKDLFQPMDIREDDKNIIVTMDIPGVDQKVIKVTVEEGVLSISGERKSEKEEKDTCCHHIERSFGSFSRSVRIPESINGEDVTAKYKNGVLSVTLPKSETVKPKQVEIKVS